MATEVTISSGMKARIIDKVVRVLHHNHNHPEKRRYLESRDRLNFACPYCGDSHDNPRKKRGNIYWNDAPKWESGTVYNARWEIDRANPKINLPQLYDIEFSLNDNTLKMKLIEDSELYLSFDLKSIKSY